MNATIVEGRWRSKSRSRSGSWTSTTSMASTIGGGKAYVSQPFVVQVSK